MIKAIILDFYGVVYTNFNWRSIDARIQSDEGRSQRFAYLKSQSNKGLIDNKRFRAEVAKLASDKSHKGEEAVLAHPHINTELISLVKQVKPKAKLALLSNGNRFDIVKQLKDCGLYKQFDAIFTSSDMNFIKPEKAAYLHAFKELSIEPSEAVIVDDSPGHVGATLNYGFNTIQFIDNKDLEKQLSKY